MKLIIIRGYNLYMCNILMTDSETLKKLQVPGI